MENLDDFMRQKFNTDPDASGERFEFREEYWEQAQALLEAEEKRRRKRRRWLLWWVFLGVIAVAVAVYSNNGRLARRSLGEGGQSARDTLDHQYSGSADDIQTRGDTTTKGFISGEKIPGTDSVFPKNNIENQGFGIKNGMPGTVGASDRQAGKNNNTKDAQPETSAQKPAPLPSRSDSKGVQPAGTSPNQPDVEKEKNGQPTSPNPPASVQNATLPGHQTDSTNVSVIAQNDLHEFNNFAALPTLTGLLDLPTRDLDTPNVTPYVQSIKPVRERTFSFGLAATATLSQASPDGKRLGATGGVFLDYRFAPAWSLTTGANWRYLAGAWAGDTVPTTSEQLRYGFGYQQDAWNLETRGLHFIEVPIGLRWQRGAFSISGGFAAGFLIGVQGRLTQQHSESLQNGVTTERSRVWLNKTPYYPFSPTVFLGGEWRVTQRLGLTLRGAYRPGSIGEKLIPDVVPPANLFWLDAGLRWYF
jgi:hypothetical protein